MFYLDCQSASLYRTGSPSKHFSKVPLYEFYSEATVYYTRHVDLQDTNLGYNNFRFLTHFFMDFFTNLFFSPFLRPVRIYLTKELIVSWVHISYHTWPLISWASDIPGVDKKKHFGLSLGIVIIITVSRSCNTWLK